MKIRCLLFGHAWKFRTYTAGDIVQKKNYLEFISTSKAVCRRCGKEKVWSSSRPAGIEIGGTITKSHMEGNYRVIDGMEIHEFSVVPHFIEDWNNAKKLLEEKE